jgi:hypothetical protein
MVLPWILEEPQFWWSCNTKHADILTTIWLRDLVETSWQLACSIVPRWGMQQILSHDAHAVTILLLHAFVFAKIQHANWIYKSGKNWTEVQNMLRNAAWLCCIPTRCSDAQKCQSSSMLLHIFLVQNRSMRISVTHAHMGFSKSKVLQNTTESNGSIIFPIQSTRSNLGGIRYSMSGQIQLFSPSWSSSLRVPRPDSSEMSISVSSVMLETSTVHGNSGIGPSYQSPQSE